MTNYLRLSQLRPCTALHCTAWHLPLSSSIRTVCSSAVGGQSAIHWLLASGFSYLAMTRACSVAPTVTREGPHHPAIRWAFNFASLIINRSREEFKKLFPFVSFKTNFIFVISSQTLWEKSQVIKLISPPLIVCKVSFRHDCIRTEVMSTIHFRLRVVFDGNRWWTAKKNILTSIL